MSTETATRDDVNRLSDTVTKLDDRAIKAAVDVGSLKATVEAVLKQTDKVVTLLQGNGQPGLVKNVSEVKVRVKQCETELESRKQNNQHNRRTTIVVTVSIVLGILALVLPVFFHFFSH
jgi:hypothetical protein